MNLRALRLVVASAVVAAAFVKPAEAIVVFSNVTTTGSLASNVTYVTTNYDIVFSTPDTNVGDVSATRFGQLVITYEAHSVAPITGVNIMLNAVLGALSGSGQIQFNEVIEDLATPGFLGTDNAVLTSSSQLPYTSTIVFSRPSTHIKVKKTFTLSAPETRDFDLAAVSLVEQHIVPEPGSIAALMTGGAALMAFRLRRRA